MLFNFINVLHIIGASEVELRTMVSNFSFLL